MLNKNKPFSLHLNPEMFVPATDAEKEYISRMRPSSTFFRDGCKRLLKNKVATVSLIIIVLITLAVIFLLNRILDKHMDKVAWISFGIIGVSLVLSFIGIV